MSIIQKKQCMHCMRFYEEQYDVCPFCGNEESYVPDSVLHLRPGTVLNRRYTVGKAIGSGGFGVTYVGYDNQLNRKIAIKEYLPSEFSTRVFESPNLMVSGDSKKQEQYQKGLKRFVSEGKKLSQVGDVDGIVRMHDIFEVNNTAYLVMEYLEGETLEAFLKREGKCSEQRALNLMLPALEALREVHQFGLIHRDLAPDNIFLAKDDEGGVQAKIIDFGSAKFATSTHSRSLTVTIKPGYSPEEQYRSDGNQGMYTDVYAMSAILYRMVTGVVPPDALERRTQFETKKRDPLKPPSKYNKKLSDIFETAILNGLNIKVEDRTPTIGALISELTSETPIKRRGSSIKKIDFMQWPLWAKIGIPAAGLAGVGLIVYAITRIFGPSGTFTLPDGYTLVRDFYKMAYVQAEEYSIEDRINLNTVGREFIPGAEKDIIVSQGTPSGSIVQVNSTVDVVVSAGEAYYYMPDVSGMRREDAIWALECMDLQVEVTGEPAEGYAAGSVLSQSITPFERVQQGDTVAIVVAEDGLNAVDVSAPDVMGMTLTEAVEAAQMAGCRLYVEDFVHTEDSTDQKVISQNNVVGETLPDGTLGVVLSYHKRDFMMPNVTYINVEKARRLLKNIGIEHTETEEYNDSITKGLVYAQSVEADEAVKSGDSVEITFSKGPTPFSVPDVSGMTEAEARRLLEQLGLKVDISYDYDGNVAEGSTISQSIAANGNAARGDSIGIVVCSRAEMVEVPDAGGLLRDAAEALLREAGFEVIVNEITSDLYEVGSVVSQSPLAGLSQMPGSTVVLNVCRGAQEVGNTGGRVGVSTISSSYMSSGANALSNVEDSNTWSNWMESLPSGINNSEYQIESKTQYSYRIIEETTSRNNSLPGWTLVLRVTQPSEWGSWGEWGPTPLSSSSNIDVESKTQYRYQIIETEERMESTYSGWDLVSTRTDDTSRYGEWSNWTDWGAPAPDWAKDASGNVIWESSDTYQIEERMYHQFGKVDENGNEIWTERTYGNSSGPSPEGFYPPEYNGPAIMRHGHEWRYRQRDRLPAITYYTFERRSWSEYQDDYPSGVESSNIESRTLYRSRGRDETTLYYYERYGNWSEYSDVYPNVSASDEVRTRTLYRYKHR